MFFLPFQNIYWFHIAVKWHKHCFLQPVLCFPDRLLAGMVKQKKQTKNIYINYGVILLSLNIYIDIIYVYYNWIFIYVYHDKSTTICLSTWEIFTYVSGIDFETLCFKCSVEFWTSWSCYWCHAFRAKTKHFSEKICICFFFLALVNKADYN